MIRFVLDQEGRVTPDLKARLPGRGLWVKATRDALALAIANNAFAKAAKRPAILPADLGERVAALAEKEVADLLGLAKRGGQLVAGFEKVAEALRLGKIRLLIEAKDGADDGRRKLAELARSSLGASAIDICAPFPAAKLAAALGREHVVHVAVKPSGIADRLIQAIARFEGLSFEGRLSAGKAKIHHHEGIRIER